MSTADSPLRVVVAGGGPAAIEALLALRALAEERVELELVAPSPDFVYRPLAVAEAFGAEAPHRFSLAHIAQDCGGRHRLAALAGVDTGRRRALLSDGPELSYDALVVAIGAADRPALGGALTFGGEDAGRRFANMLDSIEHGELRRVVFAVPGGVTWSLPLYELALMTAARCQARGIRDVMLTPGGRIPAEVVVALPRPEGPRLPGLPHDSGGFIPTDRHGRVREVEAVYAAGDATTFPVKQGGLATQQAVAVAEAVAAVAGAPIEPKEFRPVLRGLLLTGGPPSYLRAEVRGGQGETSRAEVEPLWWPPSKIAGHHLSSYLARLVAAQSPPTTGLRVEVDDFEPLLHG